MNAHQDTIVIKELLNSQMEQLTLINAELDISAHLMAINKLFVKLVTINQTLEGQAV